MSGIKLPAIERPNGKFYRPRTIRTVPLDDGEAITGLIVFGTHDVRYATIIAEADAKDIAAEFYYPSITLKLTGPGKSVWVRQVLAGFEDDVPRYRFAEDPVNGWAGVEFSAEQTEAPNEQA